MLVIEMALPSLGLEFADSVALLLVFVFVVWRL
jgi:hypothetical protein